MKTSGENGERALSFHINANEWCISWYAEGIYPETTLFTVIVYRDGISTAPVKVINNSDMTSSNTIEMHEGNNDYRVKVIAANVTRWAISIGEESGNNSISPVYIARINYQGTKQKDIRDR